MSTEECRAFLERKPTCEMHGGCFAQDLPPQLPSEWSEGFTLNMSLEAKQWQYGVQSAMTGGQFTAVDPLAGNLYDSSTSIQVQGLAPGRDRLTASTLLLGSQNRLYTFTNSTAWGKAQCVYFTVPDSLKHLMIGAVRFANFTWAEDSNYNGEEVRVFRDSTLEVAQILHPQRPSQDENPEPANATATVRINTLRSIFVSRARKEPVRFHGGIGVPRVFWDQLAGFQGSELSGNISNFVAGRPAASFFKIPKSWEPCHELSPPPVMNAGSLPLAPFALHSFMARPVSLEQEQAMFI